MVSESNSKLNGVAPPVLRDVEKAVVQWTRTPSVVMQRSPRAISFFRTLISAILGGFLLTSATQLQAQTVTATIPSGSQPTAVAVNPVNNRIYVANSGSLSVTVIDGATYEIATVTVGAVPTAVAVNPVTDKIYVANEVSGSVTVIDGATNATATVTVGAWPCAVAVNPVTDKIYVANASGDSVTVIDGATNATATVTVGGSEPVAVAVNPVTDKVYVANASSGNVIEIIEATNSIATISAGTEPVAVAVNSVADNIFVANAGSDDVTEITEQQVNPIPLRASITALANGVAGSPRPTFSFSASSSFTPHAPQPDNLLFQVDTWQGAWQAAANQGSGNFGGQTPALQQGFHILYAYATDGQEASSSGASSFGAGNASPLISNITAYGFLIAFPSAALAPGTLTFSAQLAGTTSAPQTLTLSNSGGPLTISGVTVTGANAGDFKQTNACGASLAGSATCQIQMTFTPSVIGAESATLTITNDSGGVDGSTQTVTLSGTGQDFTVGASNTALSVVAGGTVTDALHVSPEGGFNGTVSLTCSGAPSESSCLVAPSSMTLDGVNSATPTLSVTTTARSTMVPLAPDSPSMPPGVPWLGLIALIGSGVLAMMRRFVPRPARAGLPLTFLLALALGLACVSCGSGGGGGGGSTGTPAGTYTLTVTAASGSASHQVTVTLTVQ